MTPLEFVRQINGELADAENQKELQPVMDLLVNYFYKVRFGNTQLDETEQREVDEALSQFEQLFSNPSPG